MSQSSVAKIPLKYRHQMLAIALDIPLSGEGSLMDRAKASLASDFSSTEADHEALIGKFLNIDEGEPEIGINRKYFQDTKNELLQIISTRRNMRVGGNIALANSTLKELKVKEAKVTEAAAKAKAEAEAAKKARISQKQQTKARALAKAQEKLKEEEAKIDQEGRRNAKKMK